MRNFCSKRIENSIAFIENSFINRTHMLNNQLCEEKQSPLQENILCGASFYINSLHGHHINITTTSKTSVTNMKWIIHNECKGKVTIKLWLWCRVKRSSGHTILRTQRRRQRMKHYGEISKQTKQETTMRMINIVATTTTIKK